MSCEDYELVTQAYVGHDNVVTIVPYSDLSARVLYDMTDVTEVTVSADLTTSVTTGDDITASSTDVPVTIWWLFDATTSEWQINMRVGRFIGIAAGEYKLRVVIIEPDFPNGLVLTDSLRVSVVATP